MNSTCDRDDSIITPASNWDTKRRFSAAPPGSCPVVRFWPERERESPRATEAEKSKSCFRFFFFFILIPKTESRLLFSFLFFFLPPSAPVC